MKRQKTRAKKSGQTKPRKVDPSSFGERKGRGHSLIEFKDVSPIYIGATPVRYAELHELDGWWPIISKTEESARAERIGIRRKDGTLVMVDSHGTFTEAVNAGLMRVAKVFPEKEVVVVWDDLPAAERVTLTAQVEELLGKPLRLAYWPLFLTHLVAILSGAPEDRRNETAQQEFEDIPETPQQDRARVESDPLKLDEFVATATTIYVGAARFANGEWKPRLGRVREAVLARVKVNDENRHSLLAYDQRFPRFTEAVEAACIHVRRLYPEKTVVPVWDDLWLDRPIKDLLSTPLGWRSDALVIKQLAETWGPETARLRQREPMVDFRYEWPKIEPLTERLEREVSSLSLRPFRSCSIDCGILDASDQHAQSRVWVTVQSVESYLARPAAWDPWARDIREGIAWTLAEREEFLVFETFIYPADADSPIPTPLALLVPADDWTTSYESIERNIERSDNERPLLPDLKSIARSALRRSIVSLAYLCAPPEQLVEITPAPSREKRDGKDTKPWTKRLPSVRVLDPHTVKRTKSEPAGGHHAPPIGHDRRGGFVIFRHPRYYQRWEKVKSFQFGEAPPFLPTISYREPSFLSGEDEKNRVHVYRRIGLGWEELVVRLTHRRDTYVGDPVFADVTGNIYRVMESKVDLARP